MNLADLEIVVKTIEYAYDRGQLDGYAMAIEDDLSATLYPLGKWKGKVVLRVKMIDDMIGVLACSVADMSNCGGEAGRDRKEVYEILRQYLRLFRG